MRYAAGSIGCAALSLMRRSRERLQPLLERLERSLRSYIGGFSDDGACMEGLSYFVYGMTYYTGFADMLYRYTEGKTDLMDQEKCGRSPSSAEMLFPIRQDAQLFRRRQQGQI